MSTDKPPLAADFGIPTSLAQHQFVVVPHYAKKYLTNWRKSLGADAQSAEFFINRGCAKFKNGDYQGAISDNNKAIDINPEYAAAYRMRGINKELLGDLKGACDDWRKAADFGLTEPAEWVKNQC